MKLPITRPVFLLLFVIANSRFAPAEPIPAQHKQGSMHGFLLVKSAQGDVIGVGDLVQVVKSLQVHSRLVFRFRDGSVDEESTVFSEGDVLRLVSDHHIQKGPSFPTPLDVAINVPASEVTWKETKGGKVEVNTEHMELPNDLANGMIPLVVANIRPNATETKVSYIANIPKPRIVKLLFTPDGRETFTVGGLAYPVRRYNIHIELGGLTGLIAPMIGMQPGDSRSWVMTGDVPGFAKMEGAFFNGGPVWTVELASPVWPATAEVNTQR